jgi:hypothetical protein
VSLVSSLLLSLKRWLCRLGYVVCSALLGLMGFLVVWLLEKIVCKCYSLKKLELRIKLHIYQITSHGNRQLPLTST